MNPSEASELGAGIRRRPGVSNGESIRAPRRAASRSASGSERSATAISGDLARRRLDVIAVIAEEVNLRLPIREFLDRIGERTCQLMGFDFCAILLRDDAGELRIEGSHGLRDSYVRGVNVRIAGEPASTPSLAAYRSGRILAISDVRRSRAFRSYRDLAAEQGYRAFISVPLIVNSGPIGVLNGYTATVRRFDASDRAILGTIANQASIAVQEARLREAQARTIERLEVLNRSLEQQRRLLERAEEIHRQLTEAVLTNGGLETVVTRLASLLGRPVQLADIERHLLLSGDPDGIGHEVVDLADWSPADAGSVASQHDPSASIVLPVHVADELVAHLIVPGPDSELSDLDMRALEYGTTVVALELLKQRVGQEVESRLGRDFLADLIGRRYESEAAALARGHHLGFDLLRPHIVIVVEADPPTPGAPPESRPPDERQPESAGGPDAVPRPREEWISLIRTMLRRRRRGWALSATYAGAFVVAIRSEDDRDGERAAHEIQREVGRVAKYVSITVGRAGSVCRPADYERAYLDASDAVKLSQRLGARGASVTASDFGILRALVRAEAQDELIRTSIETLGPLIAYDGRQGTELVATLEAYLDTGGSVARTATRLVVHPNTVSYRLRRVQDLTSRDLSDLDELLRFRLSLLIRRLVPLKFGRPANVDGDSA